MDGLGQMLYRYFLETGYAWATLGAIAAVMLGGIGSARGLRIATAQGSGVLSEKPELFGKLFAIMILPGSQGFYGFVTGIIIANQSGLISKTVTIGPISGLSLMFVGVCTGGVLWRSAVSQGEASAASINLVARKPDQMGRALLFPALVETYAIIGTLSAILLTFWITSIEQVAPVLKAAAPGGTP